MATPVAQLIEVSCSYGSQTVLSEINLTIEAGEFVGLVGPSGSGKTTLLRTLLGTIRPSHGQVRVAGKLIEGGRLPRALGYVPQLETVDWSFPVTVEQVVMMGRLREMRLVPWANRQDKAVVRETLDRLGLATLAGRHIRALSGGQQQRVFLARALISNPQLLLLDEPTSGVDIKTRNDVLNLLAEINNSGVTIILTTHDLNSVAAHLPKVVCLNRELVAEGCPEDVFTEEVLARTYGTGMRVIRQDGMLLIGDDPALFKNLKGLTQAGSGVMAYAVPVVGQPSADGGSDSAIEEITSREGNKPA